MDEKTLKFFYDALLAARSIERFAKGRSYEEFLQDDMLASAIERKFEIIGEALVRIRRGEPSALSSIERWPAIIGFRNVLAHTYDHVEPSVVWGIVSAQIPGFIRDIESIPGINAD